MSGSPTVVLEAGMGSDARSWGTVFPALPTTTRTCAYSRANRWGSDTRGTHTVAQAAADLRAALAAAGEPAPFILAGHSLGDLPVEVVIVPQPFDVDPRIPDSDRAGLAREWRDGIAATSSRVRLTLAPGSSHMIQWDQPELVIAAVERLVQAARGP